MAGMPDGEARVRDIGLSVEADGRLVAVPSDRWSETGRQRVTREGRRVTRRSVLPQLFSHADLIDPIAFEFFIRSAALGRPFDVMLEAKPKDLAL
jgi:hypothetical protein